MADAYGSVWGMDNSNFKSSPGCYMPNVTTSFVRKHVFAYWSSSDAGNSYVKKSSNGKTVYWYQGGGSFDGEDNCLNSSSYQYCFLGIA